MMHPPSQLLGSVLVNRGIYADEHNDTIGPGTHGSVVG
jgi:hypothetical protein